MFIGLVSYSAAGWARVPPLVIVTAAIVPLLPGVSIYRGLALLAADNYAGILAMITAAAVAISLAAGVILGEYVAQPRAPRGPPARAAACRPAPGRPVCGPAAKRR